MRVIGTDTINGVTEESASEQLQQAETELTEAHNAVETLEGELRSETVDREEDPKADELPQGNLRGTSLARSSSETPPEVVDEKEAKLAEEQAKEALAKNNFEEAVNEMAKFFEFKELRAAGMRAESNAMDAQQEQEEVGESP